MNESKDPKSKVKRCFNKAVFMWETGYQQNTKTDNIDSYISFLCDCVIWTLQGYYYIIIINIISYSYS